MDLKLITPLVLTYNEELNIERTLAGLLWAERIVVVDSGSSDATLEILKKDSRISVYYRRFDSFSNQWNFGLTKIDTPWVLSIDADYVLSLEVIQSMRDADETQADGFFIHFKYYVFGKPLTASLLPPRECLFRKATARFAQDGHSQMLVNSGKRVPFLRGFIAHDDRKPFKRWWSAQKRYSLDETQKLRLSSMSSLPLQDQIRKLILPAAPAVVLYCILIKGVWRDGWEGFYYVLQRFLAEILLSYYLLKSFFKG